MKRVDMRYAGTVAALAVIYFLAAKFGLSLAFVNKQVTAVWPPTGIALASLLIFGIKFWPGVALGAFLINAATGSPFTAVGIATGNTLEAVIGAAALRRLVQFNPALDRLRDVFGLAVFAAAISTAVSATVGVASLCVGGMPWAGAAPVWLVWWLGDGLGDLVVAPVLLTWVSRPRLEWRGGKLAGFTALYAGLVLAGWAVLAGRMIPTSATQSLAYLVFPFIIWAALRFGPRETATAVFVISSMAIWGAIHDRGPYAIGTFNERLNMLQIFMGVTALTALILGAVTAERARADEDLRRLLNELDLRVRDRTAEQERKSSVLRATLDLTADGILLVDHEGKITLYNRKFVEMWRIPESVMAAGDDDQALAFVLGELKNPDAFLSKVRDLYANPEAESFDILDFKDGRVFERHSVPHRLGSRIIGRVWDFRDVTDRNRAEETLKTKIQELEQLTQVMLGREERIMELKDEIKLLRERPPVKRGTG